MDFKQLESQFEKNHTTKYHYTEYATYQLKWAFENFEKIVSKPTFQASISTNLDFQFSQATIHHLDDQIDSLRNFYHQVSGSLQKYLLEIEDQKVIANLYNDFLLNFYKGVKDYISQGLIPWIYADVMHNPVKVGSYFYDPEKYLQWSFSKFEYKLMQKMRQHLKTISSHVPNDDVFKILLNAYEQQLVLKQKEIQTLKLASLS